MKYILILSLMVMLSWKAQSQTAQWKEPECNCKIHREIERAIIKDVGPDSFSKIQNQLLIRFVVSKGVHIDIQVLKNNGNYISNTRFIQLAKGVDYSCIFQLFPDKEKIIISFSMNTIRNYQCK